MEQPSITVKSSNRAITMLKTFAASLNVLILLPPLLMEYGFGRFANFLYYLLGVLCHQRADRSFYLFGESVMYSKARIWSEVPFHHIFTYNFRDRFSCNAELGCRIGVCARCTGMYLGLLIGVLMSELLIQLKIPKIIPLFMLIPLILDGTIQTIAYVIAPEHGFYESTNPRRFITGLLFGFGIGYFAVSAIKPAIAKT